MYEYSTIDELITQFYPDMYTELAEAADGHYPEESVWEAVTPVEELLIQDEEPDIAAGLDRYVDAMRAIDEQYIWLAENGSDAKREVPKNSRNRRSDNRFYIYVGRNGVERRLEFLDYVNEYAEEFTADTDEPFAERMDDAVDDWKTQFAQNHDDWYDTIYDAADIGKPSLIDILTKTEEERTVLQMQVSALLPAVEDKLLSVTTPKQQAKQADDIDAAS
jgi:hypothetical protein